MRTTLTMAMCIILTSAAFAVETPLVKPTPEQAAWQDHEIGMFFHFGHRLRTQGWPKADDFEGRGALK